MKRFVLSRSLVREYPIVWEHSVGWILHRRALVALLLVATIAVVASCASPVAVRHSPNVILIMTDQQHRLSLGSAGDDVVSTPSLDRLAAEGARLTSVYSQAPTCKPSRTSIDTANYTAVHGVMWNSNPDPYGVVTLAQEFKNAGYTTAVIGKMHRSKRWVKAHGWDVAETEHDYEAYLESTGYDNYLDTMLELFFKKTPTTYSYIGITDVPTEHFSTTWVANRALAFIDRQRETPFFLTVSFLAPHAPWTPPAEYAALYAPEEMWLPLNIEGDGSDKPKILSQVIRAGREMPAAKQREMIARYYSLVHLIDDQIGRILTTLDERGLMDNTVILFTSDHGESLGEHHMTGKGFYMYDSNVRVPLLVRYPTLVQQGLVSDALIESIDIPQTLLELAGLAPMRNVNGRSFLEVLTGAKDEHRSFVHSAMRHDNKEFGYLAMVANASHKLVWYYVEGERGKILFDLTRDPGEFSNRIDDPDFAEARVTLQAEIDRWHAEIGFDPYAGKTLPMRRKSRGR